MAEWRSPEGAGMEETVQQQEPEGGGCFSCSFFCMQVLPRQRSHGEHGWGLASDEGSGHLVLIPAGLLTTLLSLSKPHF